MGNMSQFLPRHALKQLLVRNHPSESAAKRVNLRKAFSLFIEPLRVYEKIRWARKVKNTAIEQPVFLLGFGRSGTTHLHYLLWQDSQFGVVSNYQASTHSVALSGRNWLPKLAAGAVPDKRPMDNVAITLEAPQEEEMAFLNQTADAPLHFMSFPDSLPQSFDRWVCDLGKDASDLDQWQRNYLEILQKATILSDGKRLVLKTPTNTARVKLLLDMFPDARFVYIVRNPYRVYQSMRNMYRKVLPEQSLQDIDWEMIDAWTIDAYCKIQKKYLEERSLLPEGRLIEIKYEDLDDRPLENLRLIYESLNLGDYDNVEANFKGYLESLGTFEKNSFDFPADVIRTVNAHWGFAFDAFGYDMIEPTPKKNTHTQL